MTCQACHEAKVKCDQATPCARCLRRNLECMPHISRQGRRQRQPEQRGLKHTNKRPREETASLREQILQTKSAKHAEHYGLRYLLRSWFNFSFTRRSLALLHKATGLALSIGVEMDDLLLDREDPQSGRCLQRGMDLLYPILLLPRDRQEVTGPPLQWDEIPAALKQATACCEKKPDGNRWFWIREMRKGVSRYFLTKAFEQDVATHELVQETFRTNEKAVIELFLPEKERSRHTKGYAHQISLHGTPSTALRSTRIASVTLQTKSEGLVVTDQISCLCIVDLDQAFYFVEYCKTPDMKKNAETADKNEVTGLDEVSLDHLDLDFINLNSSDASAEGSDDELDFFLSLLQ